VLEDLSGKAAIEALTMQKWKIKPDAENDTEAVDPRRAKMQMIQLK
jgi:hypothetical protein